MDSKISKEEVNSLIAEKFKGAEVVIHRSNPKETGNSYTLIPNELPEFDDNFFLIGLYTIFFLFVVEGGKLSRTKAKELSRTSFGDFNNQWKALQEKGLVTKTRGYRKVDWVLEETSIPFATVTMKPNPNGEGFVQDKTMTLKDVL